MTSPTQRSKALLESQGFRVAIVERWNPWAKIRQDLYGVIDILAVGNGHTIGIQTTTYPHVRERVEKIQQNENLDDLLGAGWLIHVHGWKKPTKKIRVWTLRAVDIRAHGVTMELPGDTDD